jgi:hypothetical protein
MEDKIGISPGVIATEIGVPLHRVLNVLRTRPHIRPAVRAGGANGIRLYPIAAIAMVRHELSAIDARRAAGREAARLGGPS